MFAVNINYSKENGGSGLILLYVTHGEQVLITSDNFCSSLGSVLQFKSLFVCFFASFKVQQVKMVHQSNNRTLFEDTFKLFDG